MTKHETYIKRCIEIANNGLGTTRPNPMVGCVIVHKNNIIGEGFTSPYGGNHAEVNAINAVANRALLKEATLYVTLEPCSHYGKTPPCSGVIIKNQISSIVIGCIDDNKKVAGKGIEKLKNAGCNVIVGVLEEECKTHHKRFFTFHNKKRPYIILKWAETTNGFISPKPYFGQAEVGSQLTSKSQQQKSLPHKEAKPTWISNIYSRQLAHKWRTEEQAILVGTRTVMQDNPSLTVRDWTGKNPTRIVIDRTQKLSGDYRVFNNQAETIVITEKTEKRRPEFYKRDFVPRFWNINWDLSKNIADQICDVLFKNNINSVIIEGGAQTLQTFIDESLWDEARVFIGNIQFVEGVKAPVFSGRLVSQDIIIDDILKIYSHD